MGHKSRKVESISYVKLVFSLGQSSNPRRADRASLGLTQ